MISMYCIICGKEEEKDLYEGMCISCYMKKHDILSIPEKINHETCRYCNSVKIGKKWVEKINLEDYIKNFVVLLPGYRLASLEVEIGAGDEHQYACGVKADIELPDGNQITLKRDTIIRKIHGVCVQCSRYQGGYYEAIMQIRNFNEQELDRITKKSADYRVTDNKMVKGGIDLYMMDGREATRFASDLKKMYRVESKISRKIFGVKNGRTVYRITILLRAIH